MPTDAIRARLVPASFHRKLVQAMDTAGFIRMYQFTASTDHDTYHVRAQYAQETTHFFYLPDRGFLVQLALSEHIDEEGEYGCWWSGAVYLQLDQYEMIAFQVRHICPQHRGPQFFMDECEPMDHIFANVEGLLEPFRITGSSRVMDDEEGSYGWQFEHTGPLTVSQLVTFVDGLCTHFGPFLQPTLSHNFSVFGFTNDYAWPDIRKRFWRSFPTRLLKPLVPGRIRGRESVRTSAR